MQCHNSIDANTLWVTPGLALVALPVLIMSWPHGKVVEQRTML